MQNTNPLLQTIKISISALLILLFLVPAKAQNNRIKEQTQGNDSSYIEWTGMYPPAEKIKKKTGIFRKISGVIIGSDELPSLVKPISVVALSPDSFFVSDQGSGVIFEVINNTIAIPRNLRKKFVDMSSLVGMTFTPGHEILFTDSRLGKIFKISSDRKKLEVLNDALILKQPTGIAYSIVNKEIWVVETAEHRIAILDEKGKLKKTIGKRGKGEGEFNFPTFISIDKAGNAYVTDAMNFRVEIFDKNGEFVSMFGEAGDASGYFARPKGIACNSYGHIYIVDALFHNVQIFDQNGNFLYQFGHQGREKEEFWMPGGIFIDAKDNIYVADSYNSRIQIFRLVSH